MQGCLQRLRRIATLAATTIILTLTAAASPLAADTIPAFGVNDPRSEGILVSLLDWNGAADLDLLSGSGVRMYRARMRKDCVPRRRDGSFDFTTAVCFGITYDDLVGQLARRGQTFLPILISFTNGQPSPPSTDEARADFAAFAAAAARRYGPGGSFWAEHGELSPHPIRAWEIWNEENNGWWWGGNASAADYAAVFQATRSGLRSADPQARAVVGGLVWDPNGEQSFVDPADMIRTLAATNANAFDAVAIHPYTDARGQTGEQLGASALAYVDRMAEILRTTTGTTADGAPRQQIWVTEMGWSDTDAAPQTIADGLESFVIRLDEIAGAADNVGPVLWYMLRDNAVQLQRDDQLGLRRTTGTGGDAGAKAVWDSFVQAAQSRPAIPLPDALTDSGPYVPVTAIELSATTPACADADRVPRDRSSLAAVLCLVNAERASRGLSAATWNRPLVRLTAKRARAAAAHKRTATKSASGVRLWVSRKRGTRATPRSMVAGWLRDAARRKRLLAATPRLGVGVAVDSRRKDAKQIVYVLGVRDHR